MAGPTPDRPHVVMILCDQLRADALGFNGNRFVRTPNLDRLAARGAVFDNMYVQAPVCMGSRASILTGRYLRANRMGNGAPVLDPRFATLPGALQRAGYRTGMFGKLHVTPQQYTKETLKLDRPVNDAGPFLEPAGLTPLPDDPCKRNYGFQHLVGFEDILWGEWADWVRQRDPAIAATIKTGEGWPGPVWQSEFLGTKLGDVGVLRVPVELQQSTFIGAKATEYFEQNHANGPLFMQVSFVDPHHAWNPSREIAQKYSIADIPLPRYRDAGNIVWPATLRERLPDWSSMTDHHVRTTIAYYYAMIEQIDMAVGRLLDAVERAGQMDNTLFVFMADHGEFLGDYGLWRKGGMHYDCLIRVPCFFAFPGRIVPGRRIAGLTQEIDLAPTILGLLGLPATPGMQGDDLSSALLSGGQIGRPWAFTESYLSKWGPFVDCWTVRTQTAKLNFYPRDGVGHLFDLGADPDERLDVFASAGHRDLRDRMMALLLEAVHVQADPLPLMITQY